MWSVHASIYRSTKIRRRGNEQGVTYDLTATYQMNVDDTQLRITDINGNFRGNKIDYVDGFGVRQVVDYAEQKIVTP